MTDTTENRPAAEPNVPTRMQQLETLLDKAASLLAEGLHSENGVDETQAQSCIDAIRGTFAEVGKTTAEQFLDIISTRLGSAAGLPPHTEFDPLHVIDQMRLAIAIQARTGRQLEFTLGRVWESKETGCRLQVSRADEPGRYRAFPPGTPWPDALDIAIAEEAAQSAAGAEA